MEASKEDAAPPQPLLSLVHGPTEPALLKLTLSQLIDHQASKYGSKDAIVVPWTRARLSYSTLKERTESVARGLLALGVRRNDRVGVLCGDDERFIELFFACGRMGAVLVILNKTYTLFECEAAVQHTKPSVLFISNRANNKDTAPIIQLLQEKTSTPLISIRGGVGPTPNSLVTWEAFLERGTRIPLSSLNHAEQQVSCDDIINLQFTSGTTGTPKAAMLSHFNLINNARFIGDCLDLAPEDIVCCPPPLFHCFGLCAGLLAALTHGSSIVYPSRDFDADAVSRSLVDERCNVLHGVPTMFNAIISSLDRNGLKINSIKTGIAAGTKVPPTLLEQLREKLGFCNTAICYGMTETSPSSFMTVPTDSLQRNLETVGRVLPHTTAKVVDKQGRIVPRGSRGEIAVAGYLVPQGYYNDPIKTAEAMIPDENGRVFMYTGDEGFIDEDGYCTITGRIKDIIIRGGENIYPPEIEERLLELPGISQAAVVGVKDDKYGEEIAAFLQATSISSTTVEKPSLKEIRRWVRKVLAPQKAPRYVFWVGAREAIKEYPVTGSGKVRKDILRSIAEGLRDQTMAKERSSKL